MTTIEPNLTICNDELTPPIQAIRSAVINCIENRRDAKSNPHRQALRTAWMRHYGVTPYAAHDIRSAIERLIDPGCRNRFFDHIEMFRDLDNHEVVFTTQPYNDQSTNPAIQALSYLGLAIHSAPQWSWHYPGRTWLYYFSIPPTIRKEIRRQLAKQDFHITG